MHDAPVKHQYGDPLVGKHAVHTASTFGYDLPFTGAELGMLAVAAVLFIVAGYALNRSIKCSQKQMRK